MKCENTFAPHECKKCGSGHWKENQGIFSSGHYRNFCLTLVCYLLFYKKLSEYNTLYCPAIVVNILSLSI